VQVLYDAIPSASGPKVKNIEAVREAQIKGLTSERTHGKIMHNKFLVLTRRGKPVAVWTGSTNWTKNGIFAQFNNGHIVEDSAVAAAYLEYWHELCTDPADKNVEKAWMGEHNPEFSTASKEPLQAVFSPHKGTGILDSYAELAGSAKGALMMTFAFGMDERFKAVYRREDDVLRFALMEKEGNGPGLAKAKVEIAAIRQRENVVVAIGNRIPVNSFDRWLEERGASGMVHWVHTKFMLVDPLSRNPVVVIGSANFSEASTNENNENMLVIRGDTRVADIYLGEYMRVRDHYGFREMVAKQQEGLWKAGRDPSGLEESPSWQDDWFRAGSERCRRREYFSGG
jgi:phosphatidylserine/phosphatidylglycerophosphate/cardiolipin synthase-like enzyme